MTNNKQQTAVEWFFMTMNICGLLPNEEIVEYYNQAKEMEKEQHEATALAMIEYALDNIEGKNNLNGKDAFEQYYEQTYGGGEQ
jgi:hemoglobin-like flavoprotein